MDWTFIIVLAICVLVGGIMTAVDAANKQKAKTKAILENLRRVEDFSATQLLIGSEGNTGLAIDEQRKKVCLIDQRQGNATFRLIPYKDLISSELFEDGTTVTKTMRASQIRGAIVGGLVLGGVGAIIGGLSGKNQASSRVKEVTLRIVVNDIQSPLHDVNLLNLETTKDNAVYKQAIEQARQWQGIMEVAIRQADQEDKITTQNPVVQLPLQTISAADEIMKLADLRNAGLLTDEEFHQEKSRVLNR